MSDEVKLKLSKIINPATGKTFGDENRWINIQLKDDLFEGEYNRDGISPLEKRAIEAEILGILGATIPVENVRIKTVSSDSQDVFKTLEKVPEANKSKNSQPETTSAQLKVGHGTIDKKKQVPGVGKIIAIGSGKGGVGKSTFTANLALSLVARGLKVGVIDADIYGPSMPMIFGKREEKPRSNSEKKILPVETYGLKLMSFGFFINENDPVIWRGPMLGGVLNQFLFDVDWNDTDYLLIDLPPGTGDIQLSMIQNAHVDAAIVISTPQDIALLDARKGAEMFKKLNLPILGMVENMSSFICSNCHHEHFIFGKDGVEKAVKGLEIDFLGKVPLELELRTSSDAGFPYMANLNYKGRPVWTSFESIADKVIGHFGSKTTGKKNKEGLFSKIFGG